MSYFSKGRFRKILTYGAFLYLFITSQPYFSDLLLYPLEHAVQPTEPDILHNNAEVIVVPGCYYFTKGEMTEISRWPPCSLQRLVQASELSNNLKIPILVTGGFFLQGAKESYASKATSLLLSLGVPESQLVTVSKGTDTASEVDAIKHLVKDKNVVLVTSATHIQRASVLISEYSASVFYAPVDYHSNGTLIPYFSLPSLSALQRVQHALYEYGAWIKYWLLN